MTYISKHRNKIGATFSMEALESRRLLSSTGLTHDSSLFGSPHNSARAVGGGEKVFVFGGTSAPESYNFSTAIDVYDARTRRWSQTALPHRRFQTGTAVVNGKIIFAGGYPLDVSTGASAAVDILDTHTNRWTDGLLPEAQGILNGVEAGDEAIFFGGYTGGDYHKPEATAYNAVTGRWSTFSVPSALREYPGSPVSAAGKVIFARGNALDIFDPATGRWSISSLPRQLYRVNTVRAGTKVIVFGRGDGPNPAGQIDVEIFDAATELWTVTSIPSDREGIAATVVGSKLIIAGGFIYDYRSSRYVPTDEVDVYDMTSGRWSQTHLAAPRYEIAAATAGSSAVFAGGTVASNTGSKVVDVFHDNSPAPLLDGALEGQAGGQAFVTVRNTGDGPLDGPVSVRFYAVSDRGLRQDSILLGSVTINKSLGVDRSLHVAVPIDRLHNLSGTTKWMAVVSTARGLTPIASEPMAAGTTAASLLDTPMSVPSIRAGSGVVVVGNQVIFTSPSDFYRSSPQIVTLLDTSQGTATQLQLGYDLGIANTVVGNKAIFAGPGRYGFYTPGSPDVRIYDAATKVFSASSLSSPRVGIAAAAAGDVALFAGGADFTSYAHSGPVSNVVDIYHASTGQWTAATLSSPRTDIAAAVIGMKIVFAGGKTSSNEFSNAVDIYDAAADQWSTSTLPAGIQRIGSGRPIAAVADGKAIFVDSVTGELAIYDAPTSAWSTTVLPHPRGYFTILGIGHEFLFSGSGYPANNIVDLFNVRTNAWASHTLPDSSEAPLSAVLDGKAVFVGGQTTSGEQSSLADIYDSTTEMWSSLKLTEAYPVAAVAVGGRINIVEQATAGLPDSSPVDVLIPTALPLPADPVPINQSRLEQSPPLFHWTSVPGADSYDVYLDGALRANVVANQWMVQGPSLDGGHTWQIVAHAQGGTLAGPVWSFMISAPRLMATIREVKIANTHGNSGRDHITLSLHNRSGTPLSSPRTLSIIAVADRRNEGVVLGSRIIENLDAGASLEVNVVLRVPRGISRSNHRLLVTLSGPDGPFVLVRG